MHTLHSFHNPLVISCPPGLCKVPYSSLTPPHYVSHFICLPYCTSLSTLLVPRSFPCSFLPECATLPAASVSHLLSSFLFIPNILAFMLFSPLTLELFQLVSPHSCAATNKGFWRPLYLRGDTYFRTGAAPQKTPTPSPKVCQVVDILCGSCQVDRASERRQCSGCKLLQGDGSPRKSPGADICLHQYFLLL